MSLYYHVANKHALLDGMVDIVFSEIEVPSAEVDWKQVWRTPRVPSSRRSFW